MHSYRVNGHSKREGMTGLQFLQRAAIPARRKSMFIDAVVKESCGERRLMASTSLF